VSRPTPVWARRINRRVDAAAAPVSAEACSLAEYYQQRAAEYDQVYDKPERQDDLARLRRVLPSLVAGKRVLEIAAGTGYWTQVLAATADAIMATDVNAETIAIATQRQYGRAQVSMRTADAFGLAGVPGEFDVVFCGFWWSHIARADIPRFLAGMRARVGAGTGLILVDNRYVPGSNHPITRTGPDGDTYQQRRLSDGRSYEVLKNFPSREQVAADLADVASEMTWTELEYFWLASCVLG
jgi:ubiquinone/menaquinone biosynthesis C-methylase UbiE